MMKPELKSGLSSSTKVGHHDTNPKKFRLRAASADLDVYGKYFKSSFAKKISLAQIVLAVIIAATQISTLSLMNFYTVNEYVRTGIFASIFVGFAAGTTILASHKPTYCKFVQRELHTGMALNIIALLSHLVLVFVAVTDGIPRLRHHLSFAFRQNNLKKNFEARLENITSNEMNINLYDHLYAEYRNNFNSLEPVPVAATNLILTAILALGGVFQVILSFLMTIMTSRAICCGRTNLEGRFFELDPTHLGNVLNYRGRTCGGAVAVPITKKPATSTDEKEESMEDVTLSSSPPSYESAETETPKVANIV